MKIKPFSTTGIGSMPHTDATEAVRLSLDALDIPFWPQLPHFSFREQMVPQYSEGMPGMRLDEEKETFWLKRNDEEIERFYETTGPDSRVAISEDYAKGFYEFMKQIKSRQFHALKGHITGPVTFTLGLKDPDGRVIYWDEELREISLMLLAAKARWQIDMLKDHAREVIIFIDEPILSALGSSSYLGVDTEEVKRMLGQTAQAIRDAGGIAGIHCCGRADWPLVMSSGVDIMNLDIYEYGDTLGIYPKETNEFLKNGGTLAWGIVPTLQDVSDVDEDTVINIYKKRYSFLASRMDEALLRENIILTPACGTGSRTVEETTKIFQLLMRLKEEAA